MLAIFSSLDAPNILPWLLSVIIVLWTHKTGLFIRSFNIMKTLFFLIGVYMIKSTGMKKIGGSYNMVVVLFFILSVMNLSGLLPYTFGSTCHLVTNLSYALPFWLSAVLMIITYKTKSLFIHFLPLGSPFYLNPFLCLIELISTLIRPLTLTIRLAINLSTGHIVLSLMSFASSSVILFSVFYMLFELAVALVQAYIFTLLVTLYVDEHPQ